MANPEDPVTHGELSALLDEKLEQIRSLLTPGEEPTLEPEEPGEESSDKRFSLREMEDFAERQVKRAVKELSGKSAPKTVKPPKAEPDAEPVKAEPAEPVKVEAPKPEVIPDPQPGKKSKQEKWWGK